MGLACRVIRNEQTGNVEYVEAPNGEVSVLYKDALKATKNQGQALLLWAAAYTGMFKTEVLDILNRRNRETTKTTPRKKKASVKAKPYVDKNLGAKADVAATIEEKAQNLEKLQQEKTELAQKITEQVGEAQKVPQPINIKLPTLKSVKGKQVNMKVEIAETSEMKDVKMNAQDVVKDVRSRINTLNELIHCV